MKKIFTITLFLILLIGCSNKLTTMENEFQVSDEVLQERQNSNVIAGADIDNDGIWDDIQIYIEQKYSDSEKTRAAARQFAKSLQNTMLDFKDKEKSILNTKDRYLAINCFADVNEKYYIISADIEAELVNTDARILAYLEASNHLGGLIFEVPTEPSCDFDITTMAN